MDATLPVAAQLCPIPEFAQHLTDEQLKTRWPTALDAIARPPNSLPKSARA